VSPSSASVAAGAPAIWLARGRIWRGEPRPHRGIGLGGVQLCCPLLRAQQLDPLAAGGGDDCRLRGSRCRLARVVVISGLGVTALIGPGDHGRTRERELPLPRRRLVAVGRGDDAGHAAN
jgi:hypothetical protein